MLRLRMRTMTNVAPDWSVALGVDRTENDGDTSPYDSRAGYRINVNNRQQQTGNSPAGGGAIVTWTNDGGVATPTSWGLGVFEYQWAEVSDTGVDAKVSPVAAATWDDLDGVKTWYAQQTTAGGTTWVIDVTVRDKLDTPETDTVRITMNVEGII